MTVLRARTCGAALLLVAAALIVAPQLEAGQAIVQKQNLAQMVDLADRIYRGKVLGVDVTTVDLGGREFPATAYQFEITEEFLGEADYEKEGVKYAQLMMIGSAKSGPLWVEGNIAALDPFPTPPDFVVGEEYLLLTNAPNASGLAYTIGMGQGYFRISGSGKAETAVNAIDNQGLFTGMEGSYPAQGPIDYDTLAAAIRAALGQ